MQIEKERHQHSSFEDLPHMKYEASELNVRRHGMRRAQATVVSDWP
jgi:hypothetical protein